MFNFKDTLRRKIEEASLNMRTLSLRAGLEESSVKKMLQGDSEYHPKINTVEKLAKGLSCSPLDLLPPEWQNSGKVNKNLLEEALRKTLYASEVDTGKQTIGQTAAIAAIVYEALQTESTAPADVVDIKNKSANKQKD